MVRGTNWLVFVAAVLFAASAYAEKKAPMTESELKAAIVIMQLGGANSSSENIFRELKKEKMSLKRFREVVEEIAMVFPTASTEEVLADPNYRGKLSAKEVEDLGRVREDTRKHASKYFESEKSANNAALDSSVHLIKKYRLQLEKEVLPKLIPIDKDAGDKPRVSPSVTGFRVVPKKR